LSNQELLEILRKSHENNRELDITGMLLYKGGNFMQVLEGSEENVDSLYEVIQKDSRHKDVFTISRETVEERQFSNWEMAFTNLDTPEIQNEPGFSEFLQADFTDSVYRKNPKRASIMLLAFKKNLR